MILTLRKTLCIILAWLQSLVFTIYTDIKPEEHVFMLNKYKEYQTFEGFGTSGCWWAQTIDDPELADTIAKLLYSDEEGLGLDIYRYNIGAGEKDNPNTRIWDVARRTESFYVLNEETGEYEYDFTRDANARRMLDLCVKYGAEDIILFCNSPHFSMTASGHASGGLTKAFSNLPRENYAAFVEYVLTIADWFVLQGYNIVAISPINEPQWDWGGDWVGQEGCHYEPDEVVELMELFAVTMQERGCKYELRGPESGKLADPYIEDYLYKYYESEILNDYCKTYSAHSYWIDHWYGDKDKFGRMFAETYPDKKLEMSEWCELPLRHEIDQKSFESGINMANVIEQDLSLLRATSWQSWVAVNEDGVMNIIDGKLEIYNRYYTYMHFSRFIKRGMVRIADVETWVEDGVESVAFKGDGEIVLVVMNNLENDDTMRFLNHFRNMKVYMTDDEHNCELVYDGKPGKTLTIPGKSLLTIVFDTSIF